MSTVVHKYIKSINDPIYYQSHFVYHSLAVPETIYYFLCPRKQILFSYCLIMLVSITKNVNSYKITKKIETSKTKLITKS